MRKFACLLVALLLSGCGTASSGANGFVAGDGTLTVLPADQRPAAPVIEGTTLAGDAWRSHDPGGRAPKDAPVARIAVEEGRLLWIADAIICLPQHALARIGEEGIGVVLTLDADVLPGAIFRARHGLALLRRGFL